MPGDRAARWQHWSRGRVCAVEGRGGAIDGAHEARHRSGSRGGNGGVRGWMRASRPRREAARARIADAVRVRRKGVVPGWREREHKCGRRTLGPTRISARFGPRFGGGARGWNCARPPAHAPKGQYRIRPEANLYRRRRHARRHHKGGPARAAARDEPPPRLRQLRALRGLRRGAPARAARARGRAQRARVCRPPVRSLHR
mmetsp:Transcript_30978/g.100931  ORF Transcript_30978/g.100931 Transcript_30978/m.100931 type:complete len:201 (-) Transcript_30978:735-1337(-)